MAAGGSLQVTGAPPGSQEHCLSSAALQPPQVTSSSRRWRLELIFASWPAPFSDIFLVRPNRIYFPILLLEPTGPAPQTLSR